MIIFAHADGQKIAKRLSIQIGMEMKKISSILKQYSTLFASSQSPLQLSTVLEPSSTFWVSADNDQSPKSSSIFLKQSIIQNYLLVQRSSEELKLLDQDMHNTLLYFKQRVICLKAKIEHLSQEQTCFSKGAVCLLSNLLDKVNFQLLFATSQFSEFIEVSSESPAVLPSHDSCDLVAWSDSSDESDSESDSIWLSYFIVLQDPISTLDTWSQ